MMDRSKLNTPSVTIPSKRKGIDSNQMSGQSNKAASASGQQSTSRISQSSTLITRVKLTPLQRAMQYPSRTTLRKSMAFDLHL
jgi:hypothetical protein